MRDNWYSDYAKGLICFAFISVLIAPFLFANRGDINISNQENRALTDSAKVIINGHVNMDFPLEYEKWFSDHMGFRSTMINLQAWQDYYLFKKFPDSSDIKIGHKGDVNYASAEVISDYQHSNLRKKKQINKIVNAYQTINDWLAGQGIHFYVVQCVDKHTIYPEQFLAGVNQIGDMSKTDQIMEGLENDSTVPLVYMKKCMLNNKAEYEVYSNWGDPTHWTQRGAYIGYIEVMNKLNQDSNNKYKVLKETDYNINSYDFGGRYYNKIHKEELLENFAVNKPSAKLQTDISEMGSLSSDYRHKIWGNTSVDNDTKLLIMGDSYFDSYISDDFAESFAQTWMIWGDYTLQLPYVIDIYNPDIVIFEAAERVDRSKAICKLAEKLGQ